MVTCTKIPGYLWDEIAGTVNYLHNRSPTWALKLKTPEEAFTGLCLQFSHLRVIGCVAYCHILAVKRNKLESKALATLLLGYDPDSLSLLGSCL
jgi:hypothetical protein